MNGTDRAIAYYYAQVDHWLTLARTADQRARAIGCESVAAQTYREIAAEYAVRALDATKAAG